MTSRYFKLSGTKQFYFIITVLQCFHLGNHSLHFLLWICASSKNQSVARLSSFSKKHCAEKHCVLIIASFKYILLSDFYLTFIFSSRSCFSSLLLSPCIRINFLSSCWSWKSYIQRVKLSESSWKLLYVQQIMQLGNCTWVSVGFVYVFFTTVTGDRFLQYAILSLSENFVRATKIFWLVPRLATMSLNYLITNVGKTCYLLISKIWNFGKIW